MVSVAWQQGPVEGGGRREAGGGAGISRGKIIQGREASAGQPAPFSAAP